jgi:hypothetical protein
MERGRLSEVFTVLSRWVAERVVEGYALVGPTVRFAIALPETWRA